MFSNNLKKKVIEEIVLNSSNKLDDTSIINDAFKKFRVKNKDLKRACNYFFPNGLEDIIMEYCLNNNLQLRKEIDNNEIKKMKIRDQIFFLVIKRLSLNSKEISNNLFKYLISKKKIFLMNRILFSIADEIWYLAGDKSLDYNYYTKRFLLIKIYSLTFSLWLIDSSEDNSRTKKFLKFQINNVLKFGKLKFKINNYLKNLSF